MAIKIFKKDNQANGNFNGGEILEKKPIGFPQDGGILKPYSNFMIIRMTQSPFNNFCFCCGPITLTALKSTVPSILLVFSIIYILVDIVHLSGIPISGFVIFHFYPIIELILLLLTLVFSAIIIQ